MLGALRRDASTATEVSAEMQQMQRSFQHVPGAHANHLMVLASDLRARPPPPPPPPPRVVMEGVCLGRTPSRVHTHCMGSRCVSSPVTGTLILTANPQLYKLPLRIACQPRHLHGGCTDGTQLTGIHGERADRNAVVPRPRGAAGVHALRPRRGHVVLRRHLCGDGAEGALLRHSAPLSLPATLLRTASTCRGAAGLRATIDAVVAAVLPGVLISAVGILWLAGASGSAAALVRSEGGGRPRGP